MRKALLISVLLFGALTAFGQERRSAKPKAKPKPTAKWEKYTPCGVYYKDIDDFIDDLKNREWRLIVETKTEEVWYNSDKERCMDNGVPKVWIKGRHKQTDLKYSLTHYELKCKTDELRATSLTEYEKDGRVVESNEFPDSS
jgi:ATP-dependent protease HslVU (ClpYQ) ATPase subunit